MESARLPKAVTRSTVATPSPPLLELPLDGAKVSLRSFQESDITQTYINWLNDPLVVRYSNQRFRHHTVESSRQYLATFSKSEHLFFAISDLASLEVLGTLTVYRNLHHGTADIGIMVGHSASWGRGVGSDAFCTVAQALERSGQIRKLTAGTLAENKAMVRIMDRAGFELEGARRGQELVMGRPVDLLYYARFCRA
jgi:ribosomal-protein-alanine N-acetyltransferase